MGDKFEMVTAFSRDGPKKVYVQHLLKARGKEINELLEKKAYFYVCGDAANMAREVNTVLAQILSEQRGISEAKAEEIVKNMRAANQYQVRHEETHSIQSDSAHASRPSLFKVYPAGRQQTLLTHLAGGRLVVSGQRSVMLEAGLTTTRACMTWDTGVGTLGTSRIFVLYGGSHKCLFPRLLEIFSSTFPLVI